MTIAPGPPGSRLRLSLKELESRRSRTMLRTAPKQLGCVQPAGGGCEIANAVAGPISPSGRPVRLHRLLPQGVAELVRTHRGASPSRAEERHGAGRQTTGSGGAGVGARVVFVRELARHAQVGLFRRHAGDTPTLARIAEP